jgi:hypothetical protein
MGTKREIVANILSRPAVSGLINTLMPTKHLVVLNYHRVADSTPYNDAVISCAPKEFDS